MAMEYARLYFDFIDGEKGENLREQCGDKGLICLMRLWVKAGRRQNDGTFYKSVRAIEKIAKWDDEPGKLVEALLDPDFPLLDKISETEYRLHNWEINNPHLTEKAKEMRSERARAAGLASAEKRREESTLSQQEVNSESTNSQLNSTQCQLNSTNLTKRNLTKRNLINTYPSKKKKTARDDIPYEEIISIFNKESGRNYQPHSKNTVKQINNAWDWCLQHPDYKDDPLQAFVQVIKNKVKECSRDPNAATWLYPESVFRVGDVNNFEKHLNMRFTETEAEKQQRKFKELEEKKRALGICENPGK